VTAQMTSFQLRTNCAQGVCEIEETCLRKNHLRMGARNGFFPIEHLMRICAPEVRPSTKPSAALPQEENGARKRNGACLSTSRTKRMGRRKSDGHETPPASKESRRDS